MTEQELLTHNLIEALRNLVTAVRYAEPLKEFGTPDAPNPCFEARVPAFFVQQAEMALKDVGGEPRLATHQEITRILAAKNNMLETVMRDIHLRTNPYKDDENWPLASGIHALASEALELNGQGK